MDDIEKKAELRARIEAARKRREERAASAQADAERQQLEREAALEEALEKAEEEHGPHGRNILVVSATAADGTVLGSAIIKRPSPMEWSQFRAKFGSAKGMEIDECQKKLWLKNVVFPSIEEVERLCSELPFFSTALADAAARLCGVRAEEIAGK